MASSVTFLVPSEGTGLVSVTVQDFKCNFAFATGVEAELAAVDGQDQTKSFEDVMANLDGHCMSTNSDDGFWTYEVCIGSRIVQKHLGANQEIHQLGGFQSNQAESAKQIFGQGDSCSAISNQKKREGVVTFVCDPLTPSPHILSVKEPQICEYEIVVSTKEVCGMAEAVRVSGRDSGETWEMDIVETIEGSTT